MERAPRKATTIEARRCSSRLSTLLAAATVALAGVVGVPAAHAQGSDLALGFSSVDPGVPTQMALHIVYRQNGDPEAKPSPIRRLAIDTPSGTRFNLAAVPPCAASDTILMVQGPSGCPAMSQIGSGTLVAITGFGPPFDPFSADVTLFNDGVGFIEVAQIHGTTTTIAVDRIAIKGEMLTGNPPSEPGGPPDGQTAVRQIDLTLPAATGYVTTPTSCATSRIWTTRARFTFADGSTQSPMATTPCNPAKLAQPRPPTPVAAKRHRHTHKLHRRLRRHRNRRHGASDPGH